MAEALLQQLHTEFKAAHYDKCQAIISKLKLELIKLQLVPPFADETLARKHLALARETLELATLVSVATKDEQAFERYVNQLRPYYADFTRLLPASERQWQILGLSLLSLLAHNKIGAFHTELELIARQHRDSPYIAYPVQLEQWLMEGSYNKILRAGPSAPAASYGSFVSTLSDTVRDKIADCSEVAYESLQVAEAKQVLMLDSEPALAQYAAQRGWIVSGGEVRFAEQAKDSLPDKDNVEARALKVAQYVIKYGTEFERIV